MRTREKLTKALLGMLAPAEELQNISPVAGGADCKPSSFGFHLRSAHLCKPLRRRSETAYGPGCDRPWWARPRL
jgi:hypothetical protein